MATTRFLIVTADDYGMGPETSRGILDLAALGSVTSTVLLVNSAHAEAAVGMWRRRGMPLELGWHPCLTLDRPISDPDRVPSLLDAAGNFRSLGGFLRGFYLGQIREEEVALELRAQYERFRELVGALPSTVNAHHHVHIFEPVGSILAEVLDEQRPRPFVRRFCESWGTLLTVPGGRIKRAWLSALGRRAAGRMCRAGYPGNDHLAGVTDPAFVADPDFFARWLRRVPGNVVELTCHPGHHDGTLPLRDCQEGDLQHLRRAREWKLLSDPDFPSWCAAQGFTIVSASRWLKLQSTRGLYAA